MLGEVNLNLAEYVDASDGEGETGEGVCRRYLMQESKINSTLKVCLWWWFACGQMLMLVKLDCYSNDTD